MTPIQQDYPATSAPPVMAPGTAVPMASAPLQDAQAAPVAPMTAAPVQAMPVAPVQRELILYSHSTFFYWWPVWAVGYFMALLTLIQGEYVKVGDFTVQIHPSKNVGVIFTMVFVFVILFTNMALRGKSSVIAVLAVMFVTVLFAYLGWWDHILSWLPYLAVFMNLGFYVLFSTLMLIGWAMTVFVYDHMTFWRVRPGQLTQETVIGGAAKSFDTRGMVFEKRLEDVFRHWVLGLGSGDIRIATSGARREELVLTNVLFVDRKVQEIQKLLAVTPDVPTA